MIVDVVFPAPPFEVANDTTGIAASYSHNLPCILYTWVGLASTTMAKIEIHTLSITRQYIHIPLYATVRLGACAYQPLLIGIHGYPAI
jgi:hypothetical protein